MLKQKEWIEIIVAKTGCTKKEAKVYYDCVFDYIREQISPEESVKISGLGVFKLRKTAAKEQVNLVTQQVEIVPEHNVVVFRPYFEIDPKPEPIEVEDDDVVTQVDVEVKDNKEEVVAEVPSDGLAWVLNGETLTTDKVIEALKAKTNLSEENVAKSVEIIKEKMMKAERTTCTITEKEGSFDFIIN